MCVCVCRRSARYMKRAKTEVTACHVGVLLRALFVQKEGLSALPTSCFDSLQYDSAVEL